MQRALPNTGFYLPVTITTGIGWCIGDWMLYQ